MRFFGFLRTPEPARRSRRVAKPWDPDDLTDEQYETLIDLAQWSDMDSPHDLIVRAEAALDLVESLSK